jgi:hypothetical protein
MSSRVRQPMHEIAVGREHEQPGGRAVKPPGEPQPTPPQDRVEQIEDQRRLALVVAAGDPDGLMHQVVASLPRRLDRLLIQRDFLVRDPARRIPDDLPRDLDRAGSNQAAGLAP